MVQMNFCNKQRVLGSPYYVLVTLWSQIDVNTQMAEKCNLRSTRITKLMSNRENYDL